MTEDHEFVPGGAFGRCADCNRRKAAHETPSAGPGLMPGSNETIPPDVSREPVTLPSGVTFMPLTPLEATGLEVVIRRKHGMGMGNSDEELTWPAGWPLPKIGESVWLNNVSGLVMDIRFDVDRQRIIIACK